jgi:hypothetical protein
MPSTALPLNGDAPFPLSFVNQAPRLLKSTRKIDLQSLGGTD